jgi:hypothetical protein
MLLPANVALSYCRSCLGKCIIFQRRSSFDEIVLRLAAAQTGFIVERRSTPRVTSSAFAPRDRYHIVRRA